MLLTDLQANLPLLEENRRGNAHAWAEGVTPTSLGPNPRANPNPNLNPHLHPNPNPNPNANPNPNQAAPSTMALAWGAPPPSGAPFDLVVGTDLF